jgi:CheY-like chemotaxis protein
MFLILEILKAQPITTKCQIQSWMPICSYLIVCANVYNSGAQFTLLSAMAKQAAKLEDDSTQLGDTLSAWVAERLATLMTEHGVYTRQHATLLCEICGLSPSQARRKLRGSMWSFGEVLTVVRHFGASLDQVFSGSPHVSIAQDSVSPGTFVPAQQDATFLMDKLELPCMVRLGALAVGTPADNELLTAQKHEVWYVGIKKQFDRHHIGEPFYRADHVLLTPAQPQPGIRIAILDDDIGTSENYDAFVVDFLLAGGDSSQATIKQIRHALPDVPIVLLTGKLRDGKVSEADLTTMLRTANVTFYEKPVRPSVLAATIEKELDQAAHRRRS